MDKSGPVPGAAAEPTVYDLCGLAWAEADDEEEEEEEEDGPFDDEDDLVPEPVRRAVILGRNDPCWCGSGKKYKKCHLESDEKSRLAPPSPEEAPEAAPSLRNNAAEAALRKRLIEFATGTLRKREL